MSDRSDYVLRDSPVLEPIVISDIYDSWEQGVSAEDLKQLQGTSQNHSGMTYYLHQCCPAFWQFVLDLESIVGAEVENDFTEKMGGKSGVATI